MKWKGVMPAITTFFNADLTIDHGFVAEHCAWLLESGCSGIVALGSLAKANAVLNEEKLQLLRTCRNAKSGRAPLVAAISWLTTFDSVALAKAALDLGCDGLWFSRLTSIRRLARNEGACRSGLPGHPAILQAL